MGGKFPGDNFPGGQFSEGKFSGGSFLGGNFPRGNILRGNIPRGNFLGGNFLRRQFSGGQFSRGQFSEGLFSQGHFSQNPQGMFKIVSHFKTKCGNKNASETFTEQFRNCLIQFFINNYEQTSQEACFSENISISLVLALVSYSFFLSYIGNWPFKYVFGKLQVKMERNFCEKLFKLS